MEKLVFKGLFLSLNRILPIAHLHLSVLDLPLKFKRYFRFFCFEPARLAFQFKAASIHFVFQFLFDFQVVYITLGFAFQFLNFQLELSYHYLFFIVALLQQISLPLQRLPVHLRFALPLLCLVLHFETVFDLLHLRVVFDAEFIFEQALAVVKLRSEL